MSGFHDYDLFGWRVRSAFPVPELMAWRGDGRAPEVVFQTGTVPATLEGAEPFSPAVQIGAGGLVRLSIPAVASYLVEGGERVTVDPVMPIAAPDVRVFLLGTVLSILCFRRGLLPLHASAVAVDGRALLLSGDSGMGKSTLAAALAGRGYRLVADDVCAAEVGADGTPLIRPAFPRLKLWSDAAKTLAVDTEALERTRGQLDKFHVWVDDAGFHDAALPPGHIVLLRSETLPTPIRARPLKGLEAMRQRHIIHRWKLGQALGCGQAMFTTLSALLAAAPFTEVTRYADLADLPALADQVLGLSQAA